MPPDHKKYMLWNGEHFISWVSKMELQTEIVILAILASHKIEQQGYKPYLALLKLAGKYTVKRLEAARGKAYFYSATVFKTCKRHSCLWAGSICSGNES